MIEFVLFLLFYENCKFNISTGIGAKFYHVVTGDDDTICFNIQSYPFFIIFNEFDNHVIYQQYSSSSVEEEYVKTEESLVRFLPVYKMMASPFEYIVLKTPFSTDLSFTAVSLPGMCLNGLYLSNRESDTVLFSKNFDNEISYFKLNEFDDKCLIYSTPFKKQHVKVEMRSEYLANQIFLYTEVHNYTSIYGNSTIEQISGESPIITINNTNNSNSNLFVQPNTINNNNSNHIFTNKININSENNFQIVNDLNSDLIKKHSLNTDIEKQSIYHFTDIQNDISINEQIEDPFIIRIVVDDKYPPYYINVTFTVEEGNDTESERLLQSNNHPKLNSINEYLLDDWNEGRSGVYLPPQKIESCPEKRTWHSQNVAIAMIVLAFVLFLIFVFLITSNIFKNYDDSSDAIRDRSEINHSESFETSSLSSFANIPVLKTLVS